MSDTTVFAQVVGFGHRETFRRCVDRYDGDTGSRAFSCHDQWLAMAFAQLTYRDSLRDIVTALEARPALLYQMGFRCRIARSTLSDSNETRDWRIFADWAQSLIRRARKLYALEPFGVELDQSVYALDATVIDLCLSLFPWAHFRSTKAAIKLHTLMDLRGSIPSLLVMTDGSAHEINMLDTLPIERGAIYIMDRGYTDFGRLYRFAVEGASFVIRAKSNLKFRVVSSRPVDRDTGLRCDQSIRLRGAKVSLDYPDAIRRIRFYDSEQKRSFVFLTNNFLLSAEMISQLYRSRWHIELFFRWIKQHLRIHSFVGTSENAVRIQIWTAISTYLLVAIMKKTLNLKPSLHEILQVISVTPFEKVPVSELFEKDRSPIPQIDKTRSDFNLFN